MLELSHKKLDVWNVSIQLVKEIYLLTQNFPNSEIYSLSVQMRRAAVSIPSNIAEGASRTSRIEKRRYYEIARSSLVELDTQMAIGIELNYIDENNLQSISELINHLFAMLSKLIQKSK